MQLCVYPELLEYARYLALAEKLRARRRELILFCQHPPTITAGVQAKPENLLLPESVLAKRGISLVQIKRGGDYTAHEPGQIVVYFQFDLKKRALPLGNFFQQILTIAQKAIQEACGIELLANAAAPGLYDSAGAKLVSIGLEARSFFSSHGIAINYSNSLETFAFIHPCGKAGLPLRSLVDLGAKEKDRPHLINAFVAGIAAEFSIFLKRQIIRDLS